MVKELQYIIRFLVRELGPDVWFGGVIGGFCRTFVVVRRENRFAGLFGEDEGYDEDKGEREKEEGSKRDS